MPEKIVGGRTVLFVKNSLFSSLMAVLICIGIPQSQAQSIAFASDRIGGRFQIWTAQTSTFTSSLQQVTFAGAGAEQSRSPSWSVVAGKIAYQFGAPGVRGIHTINPGGAGDTLVTPVANPCADDSDPAWSPDGTLIAYTCLNAGHSDIWVHSVVNNTESPLVVLPPTNQLRPAYSPDGTQIAFVSSGPGSQAVINVFNLNTHVLHPLTAGTATNFDPAWSPDGAQIAFSSTRVTATTINPGNRHIYTMSATCPEVLSGCPAATQLTTAASNDTKPAWSPGGSSIAFVSNRSGLDQIYLINPSAQESTSNPATLLSDGTANYEEPSWGSGCIDPMEVKIMPGPALSLDGKPTTIEATFTPKDSSGNLVGLSARATACGGLIGFNWQQTIDVWPRPSALCTPATCLSAVALPTFYLSAPPILPDPYPGGGWVYELTDGYPTGDYSYPFYYNQSVEVVQHETPPNPFLATTLSFQDTPADPDFLNSELQYGPEIMQFTTSLVGVTASNQPGPALYTWTWTSDFDGTVGGLLSTKTNMLADPGSGTGGVTITSVNGVQLNPISSAQIATTASGLAYSRVSQTFNGTVTITNVSGTAISGPFQIVFISLTTGVTVANQSGWWGNPVITVPGITTLGAGQSAIASVQFRNPSNGTINFTPMIYSGSL